MIVDTVCPQKKWAPIWCYMKKYFEQTILVYISNSPVSYSARHQRPARERHKIRIASWGNVDNQTPHNTNFTH